MKVLIFGGNGLVGSSFFESNKDYFEIDAPLSSVIDITSKDSLLKYLGSSDTEVVINFAAYTNVEEAENQKSDKNGIAYQVNALGAKNVAEVCKIFGKHLIHISTEYVFDGTKQDFPYIEDDKPNPTNWYGQTKYFGEEFVLSSGCRVEIIRISMPYTPFYKAKSDIARFFLEQLKNGKQVRGIDDQRITPTLVNDIAGALKTLIDAQAEGIYHVSSTDTTTPLEFAKTLAETFQLDYSLIGAISLEEYNKNKKAKLLKNSTLNPAKFEEEFGEDILHTVEEDLVIFKQLLTEFK